MKKEIHPWTDRTIVGKGQNLVTSNVSFRYFFPFFHSCFFQGSSFLKVFKTQELVIQSPVDNDRVKCVLTEQNRTYILLDKYKCQILHDLYNKPFPKPQLFDSSKTKEFC